MLSEQSETMRISTRIHGSAPAVALAIAVATGCSDPSGGAAGPPLDWPGGDRVFFQRLVSCSRSDRALVDERWNSAEPPPDDADLSEVALVGEYELGIV